MGSGLPVDVYNCEVCTKAFCTEKDVEPEKCPHCSSEFWSYSHSGEVVLVEDGEADVQSTGRNH